MNRYLIIIESKICKTYDGKRDIQISFLYDQCHCISNNKCYKFFCNFVVDVIQFLDYQQ